MVVYVDEMGVKSMNFRKLDTTQTKMLRRWGWFLLGLGWFYSFSNVLSCLELVRGFLSGQVLGRASGALSLVLAVIVMAELVLASRVLWEAESGRPFCLHGQKRITQIMNPWHDSDSLADQTLGALGGGLAGATLGVLQMLGMSAMYYIITIGMQPGFLPRMIEAARI